MATINALGLGDFEVIGEHRTLFVSCSLDDINGALYKLHDADDGYLGVRSDKDAALELACDLADMEEGDGEMGTCMTDMEADADALASAGWGTDECYGDFGGEYL